LAWDFLVGRNTVRCLVRLLAALVITGLLATALAFTVMTWAQQHTTATRTALFLVLEPVFAALTSFVV
jgi:drug/metabolite transporter (DMT)-like permease